jgi:glycosyltransferase involved in cell wall biosynthesis
MSKANPLVSFIIATYNRADYICDAVRSILKQKYNNIEIIVIDDCSTDNTYEVLVNNLNDKFIYHRNLQNMGPAFSRNIGLDFAKGKYIGLLDSDDILYDENHTGIAVDIMENDNEVAIFCCDFYIIDRENRILNTYSPLCDSIDYIGFSISSGKRGFSDLYKRGVHSCGALLRRSNIDMVGAMDVNYRIAWDGEYFLRLLGKSRKYLYYYHKPLTGYRKLSNSLSTNLVQMYTEKVKIYNQIAADYPSLKKELGWKVNKRIALQILSLSDAYKLEKRYEKAIYMAIRGIIKYPPMIGFYCFSFLGIFFKQYKNIKLALLRI